MDLQVYCPHCQEVVQVSSELAGQISNCEKCGGQFRVPGADGTAGEPGTATSAAMGGTMSNEKQLRDAIGVARIACGLLAIFSGFSGLHKFAMGRNVEGLIMLLTTVLSCFVLSPVMWTIGIIEGIVYLVMEDEEFHERYIVQKRGWF